MTSEIGVIKVASNHLNERVLKEIINHSYDEIFITDGDGVVLDVSPSCYTLYGATSSEIIGQNVMALEKKGILTPSVTALVLKGKKMESRIQETRTGKKIIVTAYPVFDNDGELVRIISFSRDITELVNLKKRNEQVAKTLHLYKREVEKMSKSSFFYSENTKMESVMNIISKVADLDVIVLIEGESGVGKNKLVQYLHELSFRKNEPFIEVNCGAIPESLFESELFGYEEGAFTGAKKGGKKGSFETAGSGTLFLDEIAEIPLNLQVKLLSILQNRKVTKIGGIKAIDIKCRIVCATNRDLEQLVQEKRFREDLFYRIDVLKVTVPPLRERRDEISSLVYEFAEEFNVKYGLSKQFSPRMVTWLSQQEWPGNVRALRNYIEKTMITYNNDYIQYESKTTRHQEGLKSVRDQSLSSYMEEVEQEFIKRMYQKYPNSISLGKALDISQSTANRKIQKYIKASVSQN